MAATVLISRLEETPEMEPVEYGKYDEGLQMSTSVVAFAQTIDRTAYVTQNSDYEQDFESD